MLFKSYCATCLGLDVTIVTVEISVQQGVGIYLVGLPDVAVKESLLRVTTALKSCNYRIPGKKVVINLAPANIKKEGSSFDAAIAVGLLAASEQIMAPGVDEFVILGELSLDGEMRRVPGVLPIVLKCAELGFRKCILPSCSANEAAQVDGIEVYGAKTISQVVDILNRIPYTSSLIVKRDPASSFVPRFKNDFKNVVGQQFAKRGMEIAACGGHNILLTGPPGSGKSFISSCLPSILPLMSREESLETTAIYSVAGLLEENNGLIVERPFRTPHNTSSVVAMVGGGPTASPGEISLAHNGVLYLDEITLFGSTVLDLLRQPLEDREISISRARYKVSYPASFMMVASMNPCPCGYFGDGTERCRCTPGMIARYLSRISGPLLDRIDLNIKVKPVDKRALVDGGKSEESRNIAKRVLRGREVQRERFKGERCHTNAQMSSEQIGRFCKLGTEEKSYVNKLIEKRDISARGYSRILKIARTIADLEQQTDISVLHISEAVQFFCTFEDCNI